MNGPGSRQRGWHVDPDRAGRLRWWTGSSWGVDTIRPEMLSALAVSARRLSVPLIGLLVMCALLNLAGALVHLWGLEVFGNLDEFEDHTLEATADSFERVATQLRSATFVAMLLTAGNWAAWQYRLALTVPSALLTHSAEMHAGAWFVPVVNLWRPLRNVHELGRAFPETPPGRARPLQPVLALWWSLWTVSFLVWMTILPALIVVETYEGVLDLASLVVVGKLAGVLAAQQAIVVVRRLTRGGTATAAVATHRTAAAA